MLPATYEWIGGSGSQPWETSTNWKLVSGTADPNSYPDTIGDVAQFLSAGNFTSAVQPTINGDDTITVGEVDIGVTVGLILGASTVGGPGTLQLENSSDSPGILNIESTTTKVITVSAPISAPNGLNFTNQTLCNITFSSPINATGAVNITLAGTGSTSTTVSGTITASNGLNIMDQSSSTTKFGTISVANGLTITNQGTAPLQFGAISAPTAQPTLNINITNKSTTTTAFTGAISTAAPNGIVNIAYENGTTAGSTISGAITAPGGLNISVQNGATGTDTISSAITAPSGINVNISAGNLLLTSASSQIVGSDSSITVNSGGTLTVGASQADIGAGTTIILSSGSTFHANAAVALANNFVIGSNESPTTFTGSALTLTNSTITLNGADTIALSNTSTTFNADFTGAASSSLTLTGNGAIGYLGNATFTGSNSISLLGNDTLTVNGNDTLTVNAPTMIQNVLGGTGSLSVTGTSALTLSGADIFSGGTSISSGTLLVSHSGSLSSGVTIGTGGTLIGDGTIALSAGVTVDQGGLLRGTGMIGPILVPGGTVWPGDPNANGGIDILTAPAADFTGGGTLMIQVSGYATPGISFDQLNLAGGSGAINMDGTSTITLNLAGLPYGGVTAPGGIILDSNGLSNFSNSNVNVINNPNPSNFVVQVPLDTISTAGQVNVDIYSPPVITSASFTTFTVGSSSTFTPMAGGYPTPITFTDADTTAGGLPNGVTFNAGVLSGTPASGMGGIYSDTFTATNSAGSATQAFTLIVMGTSTTLMDLGPNPSPAGSPVTFTVTVTSASPISGETVTLEDASYGNATVGAGTLANGSATITVSGNELAAGSHSIFAVYGGDTSGNSPSQSAVVVQDVQNGTTTTLTDNGPNPSLNGQPISFTVSISGGSALNGETVTLEDASNGNATVGSGTLTNGSATITVDNHVANLAIGSHSIFAVYGGDASFAASQSGQVIQTVNVAVYQWTGKAGDGNWITPGNWIGGVSGSYPQFSGDVAQFISADFAIAELQGPSINGVTITVGEIDFDSTQIVALGESSGGKLILENQSGPGILKFESANTASNTLIIPISAPDGLNITLQSGMSATALQTVSSAITITAPYALNATISGGNLLLNSNLSSITSNSSYTVNSGGTLSVGPNQQEIGLGATILLNNGSTFVSRSPLGATLANNIMIGSAPNAAVTIEGTGNLLTLTNSTITLNGADSVALSDSTATTTAATTTFNVLFSGTAPTNSLAITSTSNIGVLGNSTFTGNSAVSLTGSALSISGAEMLTVNAPAAIQNVLNGPGSIAVTGSGTLTLLGVDNFSGGVSVESVTLIVDGSVTSGVTVYPTGTLLGDGTVGAIADNQGGGTVIPGDPTIGGGIGILTGSSADFTNGGTLVIQVAGYATAGVNYDQLNLGGGFLNLDGTSTITLNLAGLTYGGIATGIILDGAAASEFANVNIVNASSNLVIPPQPLDYSTPGEINLDIDSAPVFTSAASATFTVNGSSSFTPMAGGLPAPTITEAGPLPNGVTFSAGVLSGTPNPGTAGTYSDTFTATNSVGSATQAFALTVQAIPTTTTLTDFGPTTSFFGGAVTFTTAVSSSSQITGETVTLEDTSNGNASVGSGTLNSNGSATIQVSTLAVGSHSIFAIYSGDETFAASQSSAVNQIVLNDNATVTSLTDLGPNPSLLNGPVTFTAAVRTNNIPLTGETVTLYDASNGNASVGSGTLNSNNSATITVSNLAVGSHSIFAVYAGDSSETGSQSSSVIQAVQYSTATTLIDNGPNASLLSAGVNFTVNVTGGTAVTGETVMLEDASNGNATVGSGTLTNGSATIAVSNLALGSHSIFAVYGGDATHAGGQSTGVTQTVSGLLAYVSILPPVENSSLFYVSWIGAATSGWSISSYTIYASENGAPYTAWLTDTTLTTAAYQGQYGQTYSFYSVANGKDNLNNPQTSPASGVTATTVRALATTLTVTSFTPTATGFTATFSEPFLNTSTYPVHLYSAVASNANYGPADVTIVGKNTGTVTGSLIVNATNTGFTFIKTDVASGGTTTGLLAPDTYTVTFLSSPTGFQDTNGNLLDGTGSGVPGSNYVMTFTVTAPAANAVTVSIPDFARGPDNSDSINIGNNTSNGLPISLSNGSGVSSGSVTVTYNPSLLAVTGAFPNPALGGASFTLDPASTSGIAILDFASSTSLGFGPVTLGGLIAYTPSSAPYKSKELLQISSSLNGGSIPTINDNAVQVVAYLGNVSGSGLNPNGQDSGEMLNVASGSDAGFSQFPVIDPVILGGLIGGESQVSTQDVLQLNSYTNTHSNPYLPVYPGFPSNYPSGPDPTLSVPSTLTVSVDGTVLAPVDIDDADPAGGTGMTVAQLALKYNPTDFTVMPQDVQLGSVPDSGAGWTIRTVVDASAGTLGITLSSETPISSAAGGSLAIIALHENPTATPGVTAIELVSSVTANGQVFSTSVNDMQGPFTLSPTPSNSGAAPGLEGTVALPGMSIPSASNGIIVEQAEALPELATADNVALPAAGAAPTAAITDTPVSDIEDRGENTAVTGGDIGGLPDTAVPIDSTPAGIDHGAAALAQSVLVNANAGIEALPANGFVFMASAGPESAAGGNPLFSVSMEPQSGNVSLSMASASKQAGQRPADQLFQDLSLGEAGPALSTAASARDWLRDDEQPFDLLSHKDDEWTATDIGVLDGYFAQLAPGSLVDGE